MQLTFKANLKVLNKRRHNHNLLEHDGEFFERFFGHTSCIAGLDLLFQIVFHTHGKLIQLIPLLSKVDCAMLRVSRQQIKCTSEKHQMLIT